MYPFLLKLYTDAGYHGPKFQQRMARVCRAVNVEIVRRCGSGKFVVLPKRWIVERTSACLNRCRRLSKELGMPQPQRSCLPALGIGQAHGATVMSERSLIGSDLISVLGDLRQGKHKIEGRLNSPGEPIDHRVGPGLAARAFSLQRRVARRCSRFRCGRGLPGSPPPPGNVQLRDAQLETVQTRVDRPIPVAFPAEGSSDGYIEWLTMRAESVHRTIRALAFVAEAAHCQCRGSIGGQHSKHLSEMRSRTAKSWEVTDASTACSASRRRLRSALRRICPVSVRFRANVRRSREVGRRTANPADTLGDRRNSRRRRGQPRHPPLRKLRWTCRISWRTGTSREFDSTWLRRCTSVCPGQRRASAFK